MTLSVRGMAELAPVQPPRHHMLRISPKCVLLCVRAGRDWSGLNTAARGDSIGIARGAADRRAAVLEFLIGHPMEIV